MSSIYNPPQIAEPQQQAKGGFYYWANGAPVQPGVIPGANIIYFTPLFIAKPVAIGKLGLVSTAAIAGALGQVAIYDSTGNAGVGPGNLLGALATDISLAAIGGNSHPFSGPAIAISVPGLYFLGTNVNNVAAALWGTSLMAGPALTQTVGIAGVATMGNATSTLIEWSEASAYGTWPAVAAATIALTSTSHTAMPVYQL